MSVAEKLTTIAKNEYKVYDAGAKSEYDRFWDVYQGNGKITNYSYSFSGHSWNEDTFRPKYDMYPTVASYMFATSDITNLKEILNGLGITLDFSKTTAFTYTFQSSKISHIGTIDTRSCSSLNYIFHNANSLISIEKLILKSDGSQSFTNSYSFGGTINLKDIVIEGCFGRDVSFQSSKELTLDSAKSILTALKDYAGTDKEGTYTVYLSDDTWALVDADGETSPTGTTWKEYVSSKGWLY